MICGLAYQLRNRGEEEFQIASTYVLSNDYSKGRVRVSRVWKFSFPAVDGFPRKRAGASETYGLLGGVESQRRYLYSEVCERAIGDIVTSVICEIVDAIEHQEDSTTFIFGPALPKMVGRLASLHLPRKCRICWLCPTPLPKFLTGSAYESTSLPSYGESISEEWDDEPLIKSKEQSTPGGSSLRVQQLRPNSDPFDITLPGYAWAMKDIDKTWLPRELLVAAEQVQVCADKKQVPEEDMLRDLQFCPEEQYAQASHKREDYGPPGWDIKWGEHKP